MATKYVRDTAAGKSISAYVILNKKGQQVATIHAHYSNGGQCLVNVWDDRAGFQQASAGGYGYDKFTAALSGLTIDGHTMSNHCGSEGVPKKPKGRATYPSDYKVKPGYELANWQQVSRATGSKVYSNSWYDRAKEALALVPEGEDGQMTESQWDVITLKAAELKKAWEESDDCERGYSSCFRKSGLDFLKALGYRVIQAI